MSKKNSFRRYVFFRVTILALGMSLLLTFQGTQSFIHGIDRTKARQMKHAAHFLPKGTVGGKLVFEFHIASSWDYVPEKTKAIFSVPPKQPGKLLRHFENWWYFAPPETSYMLMLAHNESGEARYISSIVKKFEGGASTGNRFRIQDPMIQIAIGGAGAMLAFMILLYWTFRSLTLPTQAFYNWVSQLKLENISEEPLNFRYDELNTLCSIIHNSMKNMNQSLEREKEFLGFASHELRTPIASMRTSATLLDKICPNPSEKEREVRDRILSSSLTMKGITETLLWLSRDNQEPLPEITLDIESILQEVIREQKYLLMGKDINFSLETFSCQKQLPKAAFCILITNVVRNAFQHTNTGFVDIKQTDSQIQVINSLPLEQGGLHTGFGLGLKLIRKIAQRLEWKVREIRTDTLNEVIIEFNNR